MNSLYVTSLEAQSGKTPVALALMEQLSGRLQRVGVFRPVISAPEGSDRLIGLMREMYELPFSPQEMYGLTMEAARQFLTAGRYEELFGALLERYKAMESKADFVLCVGTDYTGVSTALEFDFNVEVARNLGSPVVVLMNGRGKEPDTLVQAVRALLDKVSNRKSVTPLRSLLIGSNPTRKGSLVDSMKQVVPGSDAVRAARGNAFVQAHCI